MPRPGTRVIPAGWEEHHRPVVEGTWTATCRIEEPGSGQGTFDPGTGQYTPPLPAILHDGLGCRVQEIRDERQQLTGEQYVITRRYLVVVSYDVADVQINHAVVMLTASDASLVGRRLLVTDVMRGSLVWERDLICIDDEGVPAAS